MTTMENAEELDKEDAQLYWWFVKELIKRNLIPTKCKEWKNVSFTCLVKTDGDDIYINDIKLIIENNPPLKINPTLFIRKT